ncbi:MAG: hypothetical protein EP349_03150 [Alphaproteobacteria bacterium]|nr:MAG: hypothetical protein EP349_03150 [Alphaproteobacteria bacterium]
MVWLTVKNTSKEDCLIQTDNITKVTPFGGGKDGATPGVYIYFGRDRSLQTYTTRQDLLAQIKAAEKEERLEKLSEQQALVTAFAEALAEKLKEPRRYTAHDKKTPHSNQRKAGHRNE